MPPRIKSFESIFTVVPALMLVAILGSPGVLAQIVHKKGQRVVCTGGEAAGFGCSEIDLLSFLSRSELGATSTCASGKTPCKVNDLWGWTDSQTGKEYVIVGREDGTSFVDISNPLNPVYLGNLVHNGIGPNVWRDIKVYADHAYIVADRASDDNRWHGVQIFDLTQLRGLFPEPVEFEMTGLYDGISDAHNIVINEDTGFAYVVGYETVTEADDCGRGLHMIDLADPLHPVFAGCFMFPATGIFDDGYTHDAQCVLYHGPDADYQGREICVGFNETFITIADVTDKANPIAVSKADYPDVGYVHQGWLSEDHKYLFQNDELDEIKGDILNTRTLVWDVMDLDDPVLFAEYAAPGEAIDHNIYVKGNFLYQSNYVDGLRILDISDPGNPVEVAYFDTIDEDPLNPRVFNGSWSNYPFFESGVIAVTSRAEGLFLLQPTAPGIVSTENAEIPESIAVSTAYPNPFTGRFTISVELPVTQNVEIAIFDLLGRELQRVYSGMIAAGGDVQIGVELIDFPAGTYYYRIVGDQFSVSKPITLVR